MEAAEEAIAAKKEAVLLQEALDAKDAQLQRAVEQLQSSMRSVATLESELNDVVARNGAVRSGLTCSNRHLHCFVGALMHA